MFDLHAPTRVFARLLASTAVYVVALATGCGEADSGAARRIGPEGGRIELSSGAAISVPADALSTEVELAAVQTDPASLPAPPEDGRPVGSALRLTPHGTTFERAIEITIPAADGANAVFRLDDDSDDSWQEVTDTTRAGDTLTFETSRFSYYLAVQRARSLAESWEAHCVAYVADKGCFADQGLSVAQCTRELGADDVSALCPREVRALLACIAGDFEAYFAELGCDGIALEGIEDTCVTQSNALTLCKNQT